MGEEKVRARVREGDKEKDREGKNKHMVRMPLAPSRV